MSEKKIEKETEKLTCRPGVKAHSPAGPAQLPPVLSSSSRAPKQLGGVQSAHRSHLDALKPPEPPCPLLGVLENHLGAVLRFPLIPAPLHPCSSLPPADPRAAAGHGNGETRPPCPRGRTSVSSGLLTDDFVILQKLASQFVPETTQGSSTRRRQPQT